MAGLVIFLHGLLGNRESWGEVPELIKKSPLGADFEIASLEYSAKLRSRSNIETSSGQILTQIRARYADKEPIYIVGYSLGGLIARELCRSLLVSGDDDLLARLRAVITAGTPLEGARFGNKILQWLPLISPKIAQLASKKSFTTYQSAIDASKARADEISKPIPRPRQLHLRMEDDGVTAALVETNFTEDDFAAGIIRGTHRKFADTPEEAALVADVILMMIRNNENSVGPAFRVAPKPIETVLPDRLILIACSHTKREGGNEGFPGPAPAGWIPQPTLRQTELSRRSYIFSLLQDARLADNFERGGNRTHQPANRYLKHGPDLGGSLAQGAHAAYMPAFRRYNGRIYQPVLDATWDRYLQTRERVSALIMSGLYGLLEASEEIQNYDVHLTDTDTQSGQSVSSMWSQLYTRCLETYVQPLLSWPKSEDI
jgi:pimeloyl-ACP methyl ester carboxylesterase